MIGHDKNQGVLEYKNYIIHIVTIIIWPSLTFIVLYAKVLICPKLAV